MRLKSTRRNNNKKMNMKKIEIKKKIHETMKEWRWREKKFDKNRTRFDMWMWVYILDRIIKTHNDFSAFKLICLVFDVHVSLNE